MLVRIRWKKRSQSDRRRLRNLALALASLLTPSALIAFTIAFWRISADLRWTGDFFISTGIFSHWQVWLITAAVLLLIARVLDRFAQRAGDFAG
jgi:cation transport ATPase